MKKVFIVLVLNVFTASAVFALVVQSTIPQNGTANVPLTTVLSATFSTPIDPNAMFPNGYPINIEIFHPDSITIISSSLSSNNQSAYMNVQLRPNNDYVAIILGAVTPTGDSLDIPYVLNFSTAPSMGNLQVSGTVTINNSGAYRAIVGLSRNRPFTEEDMYIAQATVVQNQQGNYSLPYTRPGIYFPVAVIDLDGDGVIDLESGNDYFGFYDSNNDEIPDSIQVSNTNISNINFTLRSIYMPITARQRLQVANAIAQTMMPNPQLYFLYGFEVDSIGRADAWAYYYQSNSVNYIAGVYVAYLFTSADTTSENPLPPNMLSLPQNWIDSDQAMLIAEQNGGASYRVQYPNTEMYMYGGNFYWLDSAWQNRFIWLVEYYVPEIDLSLEIYIDMLNGQLLRVTNTNEPLRTSLPQSIELSQNYPNPFNPETNISFTLPKDHFVTLQVYNIQGELVTTLLNRRLNVGTHTVKWNASGYPSGTYFYRLQVGKQVMMRKMTLMK
ncbi:MAG: T9SS type A sorting domain-containing protein [bacterium]|nr:T9SS type A sorting domain-containing protein [bacterium]